MKKINLMELENLNDCIVASNDYLNAINGGCTIKIGCNTSGYPVKSYAKTCSNKSLHTTLALSAAATIFKKPGSYKVAGTTSGSVTYLG